ncbi:P1 family peptidase [Kordiimonas sp. SCSIO 12610]|uniref:P1 family peptidase n=1 Tax=Kordiimonas sp. SCSIO 12610 TaxID=2829597 RepID=UPI00210A572D|nr:P1 family peptidase [Kordiimonas sp. SCSIO 12610]UTW55363.1 P1 family peptidase [Kordiimonas sp. SCSIO 12610]
MLSIQAKPGAQDLITDIEGIKVGQADNERINTGVTVILPDAPVAMGVDVRGGGPGTRDTEALDPSCLVEKVHGLVLSGGSVFGLAASDGVVGYLSEQGIGLPLGPRTVPVVPSAILFDLRNGGDKNWGQVSPYADLGVKAVQNARNTMQLGRAGAGFGATAGAQNGGIGSASLVTESGIKVAAIVAVNSFGPVTHEVGGEQVQHGVVNMPKLGLIGSNTTIGAVVTNLDLDKGGCKRLAMMAQDGFARAIRPIHTPFDGDTMFAMSTGEKSLDEPLAATLAYVGTLAADCVVRAIEKAIHLANAT